MWVPIVRLFRRIPLLPYVFLAVLALLGVSFLRQDKQSSQLEEIDSLELRISELQKRLNYLQGEKSQRDVNPKLRGQLDKPEGEQNVPRHPDVAGMVLPVLMMACNRPTVGRALDSLLRHNPDLTRFPVIVSQDCGDVPTAKVIEKYLPKITHIKHVNNTPIKTKKKGENMGYYKISRHYLWALTQIFDVHDYSAVVIVEDDLEISPDFYEYFLATYALLEQDPTLMCVSAWNDNGKQNFIDESTPQMLYRTDFFPGLGWMLNKNTFKQLQPKWPAAYWDDWLREPAQMGQGMRSCIRPEVSRTSTFGQKGVSNGQFFNQHLQYIHHAGSNVHFTQLDLSYLIKENFDALMDEELEKVPVVGVDEVTKTVTDHSKVRVEYKDNKDFTDKAKRFSIMTDMKSGIPRTAYRGVVTFIHMGVRVYLVPKRPWTGYHT